MIEVKIEQSLTAIGKQTFVTYYELLSDFDRHDDEIAHAIAGDLGCTFKAAMSWRVKPARTLIRSGKARMALQMVSRSARLPDHVKQMASELAHGASAK